MVNFWYEKTLETDQIFTIVGDSGLEGHQW